MIDALSCSPRTRRLLFHDDRTSRTLDERSCLMSSLTGRLWERTAHGASLREPTRVPRTTTTSATRRRLLPTTAITASSKRSPKDRTHPPRHATGPARRTRPSRSSGLWKRGVKRICFSLTEHPRRSTKTERLQPFAADDQIPSTGTSRIECISPLSGISGTEGRDIFKQFSP